MLKEFTNWIFDDIGNKIKNVAVATTLTGMLLSIIGGFIAFIAGLFAFEDYGYLLLLGPIGAVIGCIIAWLGSLTLYGFGQLIVNTEPVAKTETAIIKTTPLINRPIVKPASTDSAHSWRCSTCGRMISQNPCPFCTDAEDKEIRQDDLNWICPRCGKKNSNERSSCWSCGFRK